MRNIRELTRDKNAGEEACRDLKSEVLHLRQLRDNLRSEVDMLEGELLKMKASSSDKDILVNTVKLL